METKAKQKKDFVQEIGSEIILPKHSGAGRDRPNSFVFSNKTQKTALSFHAYHQQIAKKCLIVIVILGGILVLLIVLFTCCILFTTFFKNSMWYTNLLRAAIPAPLFELMRQASKIREYHANAAITIERKMLNI